MKTSKKQKRPRPPEGISEEALVEFHRLSDVLDDAGRLASVDRATLVLAAETWAVYRAAMTKVASDGAVITWEHNQMTGVSPHWKVAKDAAAQLRRLLKDLGFAPAAAGDMDDGELPDF